MAEADKQLLRSALDTLNDFCEHPAGECRYAAELEALRKDAERCARLEAELSRCGKDNCMGRLSCEVTNWVTVAARDAAVLQERERCYALALLALEYAKDADWSRADAVAGLIRRPAAAAIRATPPAAHAPAAKAQA